MEDKIKTAATDATAKATAFGKDVFEFCKANSEAALEAGKVAAAGVQTVAQSAAELGRKSWEEGTAHAKAVAAVKAPTDFFKLQADFARKQFDFAVAEFSKSTELTLKIAGEIAAPLQGRYAEVVEQTKTKLAA